MSVAIRMSVLSLILVLAYCFDSEEGEFEDYEIDDPEEDEWESGEADVGVMESNEQSETVEEDFKVNLKKNCI